MFILRIISQDIEFKITTGSKVIIVYGPRQVGKTTMVKAIVESLSLKTLSINGDEQKYVDVLSSRDFQKLKNLVSGYELLFIDEAQRISDIGINLKILADKLPSLKIIATGSSSFDLANKIAEPLTGRTWTYTLYPISFLELQQMNNPFELRAQLEERLVYGSYPEIFSLENFEIKRQYLEQISDSYLYKDILELSSIKHSSKIRDLLKLLAFQIGNEVSIAELATQLGLSQSAVGNYIDLLEKSFVVFRVGGFSRNLRKEVTKMDKIYFYDLGIRNIVIDNMKDLKSRNDCGQLWENFLIAERMKLLHYKKIPATQYFWRVHTGAELDYVEEREGGLFGYEFKWGNKKARAPHTWLETYDNSQFSAYSADNFLEFITG